MVVQSTRKHRDANEEEIGQSDIRELIRCPVTEALRRNSHSDMWSVRCELREGLAILHGEVTSYYFKQMAQEIAKKVPGVELVINKVNVTWRQ